MEHLLGPSAVRALTLRAAPKLRPNLSLLFQRYLPRHTSRQAGRVLRAFCDVAGARAFERGLLKHLAERARGQGSAARLVQVRTRYRLTTGIANPSPVENSGTSWSWVYGLPIIPAASLKGVARHFLEEELGRGRDPSATPATVLPDSMPWRRVAAAGDSATLADLARFLFGDAAVTGQQGVIVFFDGWPAPDDCWFDVDVLASHHPDYYSGSEPCASDRDEPNPVSYLCVRAGVTFTIPLGLSRFGRRLDPQVGADALDLTEAILRDALRRWGVGARTGAGHGRLSAPTERPAPIPPRVAPER